MVFAKKTKKKQQQPETALSVSRVYCSSQHLCYRFSGGQKKDDNHFSAILIMAPTKENELRDAGIVLI